MYLGIKYPDWLSKQMLKGIKGFNIDAYVMALEGWRRGLTLSWYLDPTKETDLELIGFNPLGKSFSLEDIKSEEKHYFYRSRGDLVQNAAVSTVHNKLLTKKLLQEKKVSTPKGFQIRKNINFNEVLEKMDKENISFPIVIKPIYGSLGKGVITNIKTEQELSSALLVMNSNIEYDEFVLEEYLPGEEYRVYVVNNEVIAATKRIPANVIGDGVSTIEQLIKSKNKIRQENPYLQTKLIKIDDEINEFLSKRKKRITDIPNKNEVVYLKGKSNISSGGDPIDVTDVLTKEMKESAIVAINSIPGLTHAGVDIIVFENKAYVIEINATAGIVLHLFPLEGEPRNVPEKIMDYYFPNTKKPSTKLKNIYFNYRDISVLLRNSYAEKVTLTDAPKETLYTKRYIVKGKVQRVGYRQWIRKQAVKNGLHGYTRNLKNGDVVVVVAGEEENVVESFKDVCYKGPKRAVVKEVKVLLWDKPVEIGFIIKR